MVGVWFWMPLTCTWGFEATSHCTHKHTSTGFQCHENPIVWYSFCFRCGSVIERCVLVGGCKLAHPHLPAHQACVLLVKITGKAQSSFMQPLQCVTPQDDGGPCKCPCLGHVPWVPIWLPHPSAGAAAVFPLCGWAVLQSEIRFG